MLFGTVKSLRVGVWVMITWVGSAAEVECVILMVAGTGTAGSYTVIEMEPSLSFIHWEASLMEPSPRAPSHKKLSHRLTSCKQLSLS